MNRFFLADEHYDHRNIIKYCKRPFKNVTAMMNQMIERHNSVVGPDDEVWHVGDLTLRGGDAVNYLRSIISKLHGEHHLVLGNHDRLRPFTYVNVIGFQSVHTAIRLEFDGLKLLLAHDPSVAAVLRDNEYLLHGHVHALYQHLLPRKKVINVSVDVWDFTPVSLNQIRQLIDEKS